MRVKLLSLMLLGLMIASSNSYALSYRDSTQKTLVQKSMGGFLISSNTAAGMGTTTLVAGQGNAITGIQFSAAGTGGVVTIYDSNSTSTAPTTTAGGQVGPLEVVFETTVAANTQNYLDLSAAPINTTYGVVVLVSGTVGTVVNTGSGNLNN